MSTEAKMNQPSDQHEPNQPPNQHEPNQPTDQHEVNEPADHPGYQASQVRLTLRMKYREICDVLDADDLSATLFSAGVISRQEFQNLEREKDRQGSISQAMMLIDKMLEKPDIDVEAFAAILLKQHAGIQHYLEEDFSEKLKQNIASRLRQLQRDRRYNLVQALPGETFELDLHRPEYIMPLEFSAEKRVKGPYGWKYNSVNFNSINDIVIALLNDNSLHSVLCTGIAGIGKSIYGQQVLCAWVDGQKPISSYDLVFLIPIRDIHIRASLVDMLGESSGGLGLITDEIKDAFNHCLQDETIAKTMLIIFDGIDEKEIPSVNELSQIICGKKYPDVKLVVTARPEASFLRDSQDFHPDFKVGIHGTNKEGVYGYLKAVMQTGDNIPDSKEVDELTKEMESSLVDFELLFVPLYLTLLGIVFNQHWVKHFSFTNFKVPTTVSRLFHAVINILLRKWLIRSGLTEQAETIQFDTNPINKSSNLPILFKSKLVNFGKISHALLCKESYDFNPEILEEYHISQDDLFNSGLFCTSEEGGEIVCFYRHKTLQEYMSALYLSHEPRIMHAHVGDILLSKPKKDPIYLSDIFFRLEVVAKFLFGVDGALSVELLEKLGDRLALVGDKDRGGEIQISFESSLLSEIEDGEVKKQMLRLLFQAYVVREKCKMETTTFSSASLCKAFSDDEKKILLDKWFHFKKIKSEIIKLSHCNKVLIILHGMMEFPNIKEIQIKQSGVAHVGLFQHIFPKLEKLQIDYYSGQYRTDEVASKMLVHTGTQNPPTLTHVTVRGHDEVLGVNLVEALTSQSQLQSLILYRVDILPNIRQVRNTGSCFWAHLTVLELHQNVEESGVNPVDNLMWLIENHTPCLQALTFGVWEYYDSLDSASQKLCELILARVHAPPLSQLTTLRLYQVLTDEGFTQLCGVLPQMTALTTLGLDCRDLDSEDVCKTLMQTLLHCPSITHLHIAYDERYRVKDEAQTAIKQFTKMCKNFPKRRQNLKFRVHNFETGRIEDYKPPGCSIQ